VDLLKKSGPAVDWLRTQNAEPLYASEISVFELYVGLFRISAAKGKSRLKKRTQELEQVLALVDVLPFDRLASIESARVFADLINRGIPIDARDVMIAGTALSKGITRLLTRNTRHFRRIPSLTVESY
jgi:predicted nucleic acid-binding protein